MSNIGCVNAKRLWFNRVEASHKKAAGVLIVGAQRCACDLHSCETSIEWQTITEKGQKRIEKWKRSRDRKKRIENSAKLFGSQIAM